MSNSRSVSGGSYGNPHHRTATLNGESAYDIQELKSVTQSMKSLLIWAFAAWAVIGTGNALSVVMINRHAITETQVRQIVEEQRLETQSGFANVMESLEDQAKFMVQMTGPGPDLEPYPEGADNETITAIRNRNIKRITKYWSQ